MDLRQLQAFLAVVDHGSFSAAADALFTVQSNVSAHVARLEGELDVKLLVKLKVLIRFVSAVADTAIP